MQIWEWIERKLQSQVTTMGGKKNCDVSLVCAGKQKKTRKQTRRLSLPPVYCTAAHSMLKTGDVAYPLSNGEVGPYPISNGDDACPLSNGDDAYPLSTGDDAYPLSIGEAGPAHSYADVLQEDGQAGLDPFRNSVTEPERLTSARSRARAINLGM